MYMRQIDRSIRKYAYSHFTYGTTYIERVSYNISFTGQFTNTIKDTFYYLFIFVLFFANYYLFFVI